MAVLLTVKFRYFEKATKISRNVQILKFIYSKKATKFCKISTLDLSYVVTVKSTVEISQNFVAFSEYMNFKIGCCWMKEEDIPRLHLHISERAVANHNSYDLISGKNVLGTNTYKVCIYRVASWSLLQYILL